MIPKNSLKRIGGVAAVAMGCCLLATPVLARYYYPPASFFQPTYNLIRGLNLREWLEKNDFHKKQDFQTLAFLLDMANLTQELQQEEGQTFTLLAPTDKAFAKLEPQERSKLLQPDKLQKLLKYHLVPQEVTESDFEKGSVVTVEGNAVKVMGLLNSDNSVEVKFNEALASPGMKASKNVIVIPLDLVLIPPDF